MADLPVSVNLTALFTSMTEYSAVDLRGLMRNASSKYCQRIFGSKIIWFVYSFNRHPRVINLAAIVLDISLYGK